MKLNIGGGTKRKAGYKNVDLYVTEDGDFVHDVKYGLPSEIEDNSVDAIYAAHIFEHIPSFWFELQGVGQHENDLQYIQEYQPRIKMMNDCYRVLKPGAQLEIYVPHRFDYCAYTDPTHEWFMDESSFDHFCIDDNGKLMGEYMREYGFKGKFKKIVAEGIKHAVVEPWGKEVPTQVHFILEAVK